MVRNKGLNQFVGPNGVESFVKFRQSEQLLLCERLKFTLGGKTENWIKRTQIVGRSSRSGRTVCVECGVVKHTVSTFRV